MIHSLLAIGQSRLHSHSWILALPILSAALFALAAIMPEYCDWFVFIFLVPIFFVVLLQELTSPFCTGFLWGVVYFSLLWKGVFQAIIEHGHGSGKFLALPFLLVYAACHSGIWFWSATKFALFFRTPKLKALCWVAVTYCYFLVLYHYLLWFCAVGRGCFFCLPLLPLAQHAAWLSLLWLFKTSGLSLLLILGSMSSAYALQSASYKSVALWLLCMLPFIIGWLVPVTRCVPSYVNTMGYLKPTQLKQHPYDCALALNEGLQELTERNSELTTIFLPESSYPFALNTFPAGIELLSCLAGNSQLYVVLGGHGQYDDTLRNTFYVMHETCITDSYDKTILMPFTEYLPSVWQNFSWARALFLKGKKEFAPKEQTRRLLEISDNEQGVPYICCELFFNTDSACSYQGKPLLCLINDSWFASRFTQHLLYLFARYKSLEWYQDLLYISHTRGLWFCPEGLSVNLAST